jgi:hypothetical protein
MGKVNKVPLTGRGTIHGITIEIDKVKLTEFDLGLLEIHAPDNGIPRFTEHATQLNNPELEKQFVNAFTTFVKGNKK